MNTRAAIEITKEVVLLFLGISIILVALSVAVASVALVYVCRRTGTPFTEATEGIARIINAWRWPPPDADDRSHAAARNGVRRTG